MSTLNTRCAALQKFSTSAYVDRPHVRAIEATQALVRRMGDVATKAGCETHHLFNYRFYFGSQDSVDRVLRPFDDHPAPQASRSVVTSIDSQNDVDPLYLSWLLMVADHLFKLNLAPDRSTEDGHRTTLDDWMERLRDAPLATQVAATFAPTIEVVPPGERVLTPRYQSMIDLAALGLGRGLKDPGLSLCLLDGDGIKKAAPTAKRPSLFAMHATFSGRRLSQGDDIFFALKEIYAHRAKLDGHFDEVISKIIRGILHRGYTAQYLGGDEAIAVAPFDDVQVIAEQVCAEASFEISFSCGASPLPADNLDESLAVAELRLGEAKRGGGTAGSHCR